jgi:hypothetical protein
MTSQANDVCSICNNPLESRVPVGVDPELSDVECPQCGVYRIGVSSEESMARQSTAHRNGLVRVIQAANARGNRYCINNGREIELE